MKQQKKLSILIIDDEPEYREVLRNILDLNGYNSRSVESGEEGLSLLEGGGFDVLLTDLLMTGIDGIEVLERAKQLDARVQVIIVTGYGTVHNAVEAMKKGAFGYFVKSHDPEELVLELKKIERIKHLEIDNQKLRVQHADNSFLLESANERFNNVLDVAEKVAQNDSNVLLLGESGVGKEVIARYIHQCRENYEASFITVNANSLPESLLESELYGYEKGAFTGAYESRIGRFEAANGGILFIDEIGDLSLDIQIKLLRNIENKEVYRIGSNTPVDVQFKLISATNKDLKEATRDGTFREDLFYRVSTITIEIPPLRERSEDLEALIHYFVQDMELRFRKRVVKIDNSLWDFLLSYPYFGNIRELKNIVERLVVLTDDGVLRYRDLPPEVCDRPSRTNAASVKTELPKGVEDILPLKEMRARAEESYIREVLRLCGNNMSETARRLELSRRQLFNKMRDFGI